MFELLLQVLTEHDLLNKPYRIFNVDETGVQLNNKPGKVIDMKILPGPSCSNQMLLELDCDEVLMTATVAEIPIKYVTKFNSFQGVFDTSPNTAREDSPSLISSLSCLQPNAESTQETPSKFLQECSPIPTVPMPLYKRGKQSAAVLTSKENIAIKRNKCKLTPNIPCKGKSLKKTVKKRSKADLQDTDTNTTCDSDNFEENTSNECVECFERFEETQSTVDWIQCVMCKKWLHETCTMYGDYYVSV
ncbi:unnamed protein product [Euphydryas editha]|uniref:Transposase n=1 Tax=Euphydryas editha TaxID=104508 RepID=A0AAU9UR52_EUPED|nr:unnamed protein product [Euphydryas editha]